MMLATLYHPWQERAVQSLRHHYWYVMVSQQHILLPDSVCDILHHNLHVFVAGIFLPCDFFVEFKQKKLQEILLVATL